MDMSVCVWSVLDSRVLLAQAQDGPCNGFHYSKCSLKIPHKLRQDGYSYISSILYCSHGIIHPSPAQKYLLQHQHQYQCLQFYQPGRLNRRPRANRIPPLPSSLSSAPHPPKCLVQSTSSAAKQQTLLPLPFTKLSCRLCPFPALLLISRHLFLSTSIHLFLAPDRNGGKRAQNNTLVRNRPKMASCVK